MMKSLSKLGIVNLIKGIYGKTQPILYLKQKYEWVLLMIKNKTMKSAFTPIQHRAEGLASGISQEKEIKGKVI